MTSISIVALIIALFLMTVVPLFTAMYFGTERSWSAVAGLATAIITGVSVGLALA